WRQIGVTAPQSAQPKWDGSPLAGRTILLYSEQGLGDSIQFVRYVSMLREQRGAGRVVVVCEPPLMPLLKTIAGVDEVAPRLGSHPRFDVHCALASLPYHFGTTLATIPHDVPYVAHNAQRAAQWREELKLTRDVRNVGLVWAGSSVHKNDRNRSCRLSDFAPLGGVGNGAENVRFVSLQLGPARDELASAPPGMTITDAAGGIRDFSDSAALLAELDLLITVDTAPAHLAGALGRSVWTILPFVPDFRWMLDRTDSPWYPTMRLFRQSKAGDWAGVMGEVSAALSLC
ncbi:MAG: glycosyltransferase family 9 protein, partial [Tepidisphaeraceae bacterium]